MKINFRKYHGAGNDFIMIDNRKESFPNNNSKLIKQICNRNFGIGADGLILLNESQVADFKILYFNSDGNPSSLCGNGSRCAFAFANELNVSKKEGIFEAYDGIHSASLLSNKMVCLKMNDINKIKKSNKSLFINTGSPHHLEFVTDLSVIDVKKEGAKLRYSSNYARNGSNINFVEKINSKTFSLRTYERGVEDETLSCGTGAVAAGIGAHFFGLTKHQSLNVKTLGGDLYVQFNSVLNEYIDVKLTGPAEFIFSGNFTI